MFIVHCHGALSEVHRNSSMPLFSDALYILNTCQYDTMYSQFLVVSVVSVLKKLKFAVFAKLKLFQRNSSYLFLQKTSCFYENRAVSAKLQLILQDAVVSAKLQLILQDAVVSGKLQLNLRNWS